MASHFLTLLSKLYRFRFDYFLRSCSADALGKRCEALMKAAEKEDAEWHKRCGGCIFHVRIETQCTGAVTTSRFYFLHCAEREIIVIVRSETSYERFSV